MEFEYVKAIHGVVSLAFLKHRSKDLRKHLFAPLSYEESWWNSLNWRGKINMGGDDLV